MAGTLLQTPRHGCGCPRRGGGDNGLLWGPDTARGAGSGTGEGHEGTPSQRVSQSPTAAARTPGQGEAPEDSQVPTEPRRGCCHHQSPTLGSQAGRWWEGTPSSPSHKPPQPAERVPLPPRGASHQGGRGSHPAGCQRPVKPPSSYPVKPVSNWGGVITSCSVRSTAKPDHTVPTPKRQGRAQSLLR